RDAASKWFASDIFIIFVVVLLLVLLVLGAVCCWFVRRNRTQRATAMKLTEIEIISAGDGLEKETQAKFTLKIRTDQSHATQLVEMLVGRRCLFITHHRNGICWTVPFRQIPFNVFDFHPTKK
uniref:Uncharacterized protein n=1 Tax=Salmo trutta TaxID=8032 RepID=A0A674E0S7_SALTR